MITYKILNWMFSAKTDWKPFRKAVDNNLIEFLVEKNCFEKVVTVSQYKLSVSHRSPVCVERIKRKHFGAARLLCSVVPIAS